MLQGVRMAEMFLWAHINDEEAATQCHAASSYKEYIKDLAAY